MVRSKKECLYLIIMCFKYIAHHVFQLFALEKYSLFSILVSHCLSKKYPYVGSQGAVSRRKQLKSVGQKEFENCTKYNYGLHRILNWFSLNVSLFLQCVTLFYMYV